MLKLNNKVKTDDNISGEVLRIVEEYNKTYYFVRFDNANMKNRTTLAGAELGRWCKEYELELIEE